MKSRRQIIIIIGNLLVHDQISHRTDLQHTPSIQYLRGHVPAPGKITSSFVMLRQLRPKQIQVSQDMDLHLPAMWFLQLCYDHAQVNTLVGREPSAESGLHDICCLQVVKGFVGSMNKIGRRHCRRFAIFIIICAELNSFCTIVFYPINTGVNKTL